MSYYEKIERYLENLNANQDIIVQIDDIDAKSITFSVYDCEVTDESLQTIYEVLQFIFPKKGDINHLSCITYHPSKNGSQECFNLRFELYIGEDIELEEELYQKSKDAKNELDFETQREQKKGIY